MAKKKFSKEEQEFINRMGQYPSNANINLRIVTLNLPIPYLDYISFLKRKGLVASRTEYVRWATGNQIERDLQKMKGFDFIARNGVIEGDFVIVPDINQDGDHIHKIVKVIKKMEHNNK